MAVKVMRAATLLPREADPPDEKRPPETAGRKPKRRRSSVYDANGNEVFITLLCLKCHKVQPLSQFGLRRMADGAIRNQPWCRTCRSGGATASRRRGGTHLEAAPPPTEVSASVAPEEKVVDSGLLAAQVVAALQGGRR